MRETLILWKVLGLIAKLDILMALQTPKIIVIDSEQDFYKAYESYFETYLDYSLSGIYPSIKEALKEYDLTLRYQVFTK